jgi:hypothetical protein
VLASGGLRSAFLGRPTSYPSGLSGALQTVLLRSFGSEEAQPAFSRGRPGRWAQTMYVQRS